MNIGAKLVSLQRLRPVRKADPLKSIVNEHNLGPVFEGDNLITNRAGFSQPLPSSSQDSIKLFSGTNSKTVPLTHVRSSGPKKR